MVWLSRSPALTSNASAMLNSISKEKERITLGASMALRWERLIWAFSAKASWDIPFIFRKELMVRPNSINRSRFLNSTSFTHLPSFSIFIYKYDTKKAGQFLPVIWCICSIFKQVFPDKRKKSPGEIRRKENNLQKYRLDNREWNQYNKNRRTKPTTVKPRKASLKITALFWPISGYFFFVQVDSAKTGCAVVRQDRIWKCLCRLRTKF